MNLRPTKVWLQGSLNVLCQINRKAAADEFDEAPINYRDSQPTDRVAKVLERVAKGEASLQGEDTYNWETGEWLAPVNFLVSKIVKFGGQPVSIVGGVNNTIVRVEAPPLAEPPPKPQLSLLERPTEPPAAGSDFGAPVSVLTVS